MQICPLGHPPPHRAQLVDVPSGVSQPSASWALQFAKPALQTMPHRPAVHAPAAFATDEHTFPHDPQLFLSFDRATSHPFAYTLSQFENPAAHVSPQRPAKHPGAPFACIVQATPHAPQLPIVVSAVSQPFATMPSQSAYPVSHRPIVQCSATHAGSAWGRLHRIPQVPQLSGSVETWTHDAPHRVSLGSQFAAQALREHTIVPTHAFPQRPQFAPSVARLASHPVAGLWSQFSYGAVHASAHVFVAHDPVPCSGDAQTVPHAPQLASVFRAVSHPSSMLRLQLPKLPVHVIPHCMSLHTGAAFAPATVHCAPQAPQLATLVMSASHPFASEWSQSPKLGMHGVWHTPAVHIRIVCDAAGHT